jgi:hypothetical protein
LIFVPNSFQDRPLKPARASLRLLQYIRLADMQREGDWHPSRPRVILIRSWRSESRKRAPENPGRFTPVAPKNWAHNPEGVGSSSTHPSPATKSFNKLQRQGVAQTTPFDAPGQGHLRRVCASRQAGQTVKGFRSSLDNNIQARRSDLRSEM